MEYVVCGYESRGSWVANCAIKPEFVAEMLEIYSEDLLYVDADAILHRSVHELDHVIADIGAHYLMDRELLSGTLFFRNNEKVKKLVDRWVSKRF